jgi:hypothetical protein
MQYWVGNTQMGIVTAEVAAEIIENARRAGNKVYDNRNLGYFTVETGRR